MNDAQARRLLLAAVGPTASQAADPDALLGRLRMIQLDPLDRIGTNADLVAMARGEHRRGAVHQARSFEHVAKERCLLPPEAFPAYRDEARRRTHWRHTTAMRGVPEAVCEAVLAEVSERGPLISRELSDHGRVDRQGTGGWSSVGKLGSLALKVLAARCELVVSGRRGKERIYDLPTRALPEVAEAPAPDFTTFALRERVLASGLLSLHAGPWWGALKHVRKGPHDGFVRVEVGGRPFLTTQALLDARWEPDDRLRILGPLDPLLWNRKLVEHLFGFRYLWEVYKPKERREWGYYVCPLLFRGELVGRIEARFDGRAIQVEQLWWEGEPHRRALEAALERHTELLC